MSTTIERTFATRRQAELAIEHLVQEHGFERTDIFVAPEGQENSAGQDVSGADNATVLESERDDAAVESRIVVSVDLEDDSMTETVESVFSEFDGE